MTRRATPESVRARRDGESGQALLELALVVPILVVLVMAIFQFAYVIESQMGLTNAVREAARRAAATTTTNPNWTTLHDWTVVQLNGDGGSNPGLLAQNVQGYDAGSMWPTYPNVTFCSYDAAGVTNYRIKVEVKYKHPIFFALMSFATDFIDGTQNDRWDLFASAEMRMENVDATEVNATGTPPGTC